MRAARNQSRGIIEVPVEQSNLNSLGIADEDQTLAKSLARLSQGEAELALVDPTSVRPRLLQEPNSRQAIEIEIVFADPVRLELELAAEMGVLQEKLQRAKLQTAQRQL